MGGPIDRFRRFWHDKSGGNVGADMADWRKFHFERDKFIDLVLYFSQRGLEEGLVIGSTKLNKLLFFTDMRAYTELGAPVTGARYQRLQFGPAARAMLPVRNELVEAERAVLKGDDPADWNDVIVPHEAPDMSRFSQDELRIADEVFEEMRAYNATAISDYSHLKSAGWMVMEDGEDIPYEAAFVLTDPAPPEAVQLGRELAARYGW
jgi:uncharacterized phage-associated protein